MAGIIEIALTEIAHSQTVVTRQTKGKFRSKWCITCMPKVPHTLACLEGPDKRFDPFADARDGWLRDFAKNRLERMKHHLDRIEVRRILRQVARLAPAASMASSTPTTLWAGRLSITTISPRLSVGAQALLQVGEKISPFIAPLIVIGATIPVWRKPATNVAVCQCPSGTYPINRSPRGLRPFARTISVLTAVSSINTSLAGSRNPCSQIQRRRALPTSARCCSAARKLFLTVMLWRAKKRQSAERLP